MRGPLAGGFGPPASFNRRVGSAYLRETKGERLLCLASRAPHEPVSVPFRNLETLYGDDANDGVLPSHGPAFHVWRIDED